MLVLTRFEKEKIRLRRPDGDDIVIEICKFERGREGDYMVHVGIDASHDVNVVREEVHQRNVERGDEQGDNRGNY